MGSIITNLPLRWHRRHHRVVVHSHFYIPSLPLTLRLSKHIEECQTRGRCRVDACVGAGVHGWRRVWVYAYICGYMDRQMELVSE